MTRDFFAYRRSLLDTGSEFEPLPSVPSFYDLNSMSSRSVYVVTQVGQKVHRLVDVLSGGTDGDAESGGQTGVGVAVAQVGQHEQRLAAGVAPPPPPGSALGTVPADQIA